MRALIRVCQAVITLLCLLPCHEYVLAQGRSNEHLLSCSVSKDDNCNEERPRYSEVEAALVLGNETLFENALQNILVERVVGTAGHAKVADYIKTTLWNLGWQITSDAFESQTPRGVKPFENIIAQLNPGASKAIALACHYDSKYFEEFSFLAATDSAVPCAMMINLAQTLHRQLQSLKQADLSLDLIFFDGEEALLEWTSKDSLYGARHLAAKMQRENTLPRLDLLVLLDLLGAEYPIFQSHFANTDNEHRLLVQLEKKLRADQKIRGRTFLFEGSPVRYFQDVPRHAFRRQHITIEDDHVPFWKRGVRVLHIIPTPFPSVWHKRGDSRDALDMGTIQDLNVLLRAFILRYFKL